MATTPNIQEATAFLYSLKPRGIRFGLENTRLVLDALGRPESDFAVVHLAGSNGKGSTAAFLDQLLRRHGLRVGLYTSPHLLHFRERFRIDGREVDDQAICRQVERLWRDGLEQDPEEILDFMRRESLVERMDSGCWYRERGQASRFSRMTFFESTTVLAALLFAEAGVDVAIMETGMGGRLDATNVFQPKVCGLTSISLEHCEWLGPDLASIAAEKAGIFKPGIPVVCAPQVEEVASVIRAQAQSVQAPLRWVGVELQTKGGWRAADFENSGLDLRAVRLGLRGDHQLTNAAVALGCAAEVVKLDGARARLALESTRWPGRFEMRGPGGIWVLDGAHNPAGCRVLVEAWRDSHGPLRPTIVFGVLGDKELSPMIEALAKIAKAWILVRPKDARGRPPQEYAQAIAQAEISGSLQQALDAWWEGGRGPLLVCGSLTLWAEATLWFENKNLDEI